MLEEVLKDAIQLGSVVDLIKHLARLNPLVAHYIKVNLRMTVQQSYYVSKTWGT